MTGAELAEVHRVLQQRADNFAASLRAQRVHVGISEGEGRGTECVTCGVPWPCSTERARAERAER